MAAIEPCACTDCRIYIHIQERGCAHQLLRGSAGPNLGKEREDGMTHSAERPAAQPAKQTIVLIHGAFHGGWCWRRVATPLREAGHTVFTPTMTGLGERAHLLSAQTGLNSMIQDIVSVIENEELEDVVLVGHSFGCLPVLGAADRIPDRLRRVVLLDGMVVKPWKRAADNVPAKEMAARVAAAWRHGRGLAFPPPPASSFGVSDPEDVAWVERRMTPQPINAYLEQAAIGNPLGNGLPVTYVYCTDPIYAPAATSHEAVREAGFEWREIPASHDLMVTHPDLTIAEILR